MSGSYRIIAPYWADVDTKGTGRIFYRQSSDPNLIAKATSEIRRGFPNSQNVTVTNLLIATWDAVGYYYRNSDKVRYALIITVHNAEGAIKVLWTKYIILYVDYITEVSSHYT